MKNLFESRSTRFGISIFFLSGFERLENDFHVHNHTKLVKILLSFINCSGQIESLLNTSPKISSILN